MQVHAVAELCTYVIQSAMDGAGFLYVQCWLLEHISH